MHRTSMALVVASVLGLVALYAGEGRLTGSGSGRPSGCSLSSGPAEGALVPILAECVWPVPAERVNDMLMDWARHGAYFSNLAESAIVAENDGIVTVRQVHRAWAFAEREVLVEWRVEPLQDGIRYTWRKADDQSAISRDRVEVEETRGFWEVHADGGKTRLLYEARYLPGGDVPPFLVRMFMASGMKGVLADFRDAVDATSVATSPVRSPLRPR